MSAPRPRFGSLVLASVLVALSAGLLAAPAMAETFTVDTTVDNNSPGYECEVSEECSLRSAIDRANGNEGADTISFAGLTAGSTIDLGEASLSRIEEAVTIDGDTALGATPGEPAIELDGNAVEFGNPIGLEIFATHGVRIEGLAIGGLESGIVVEGGEGSDAEDNFICNNWIGVGLDGQALPNNVGVKIEPGSDDTTIGDGEVCPGNVVSGNFDAGLSVFGNHTVIESNLIGTDPTGTGAIPNGTEGEGGAGVVVGGVNTRVGLMPFEDQGGFGGGNTIAHNFGPGVFVEAGAPGTSIRRNSIFANSGGSIDFADESEEPTPLVEARAVFSSTTRYFIRLEGATPETLYDFDLYANAQCDASGFGPAEVLLGSGEAVTDASGAARAEIEVEMPSGVDAEGFTATATSRATNDTSGLGECGNFSPDTTIESAPGEFSNSSEATISFSGSDSGKIARFECLLDGGGYEPCDSPQHLTGLSDGTHTFKVYAVDEEGFPDFSPATVTWTVDTVPPTISIQSGPPAETAETTTAFALASTDLESGLSGYECNLDDSGYEPCDSPFELEGLEPGPHTFEAVSIDGAGNKSLPARYEWLVSDPTLDTTIESAPGPFSNSSDATIGFSGSGGGTVVALMCKLDGDEYEACQSPRNFSGLSDGSHTFSVYAVDSGGLVDETPATVTWTVDTTPPSSSIEAGPPSQTEAGSATIKFSGSDSGSGVASYECSLDGGAYEACSSPYEAHDLAAGHHTLAVRSVDAAGNKSAPTTYEWTVQAKQPSNTEQLIETKPTPVNGESVAVAPKEGVVYITRPNGKKKKLREGQTIPVGSVIDATHGKVTLTSINANGEEQTANFFGGIFVVLQHEGSGLVILKLRGGDLSSCPKGGAGTSGARKGRRLWGSGHGNFRTEGNYGSATVRGTIWLTEDRCDGTFFKTRRGIVEIRDFTTHKTLSLPKGHRYLAKP